MNRADLVIVDFRAVNPNAGERPALVVQNDRDNARMLNTVVVQIANNLSRASADTQLLVDAAHPDWSASGLRRPSVENCSAICTVERRDIARILGRLSPATMQPVSDRMRIVLGIV